MIELIRRFIHWIHRMVPKENHAVIYGWPDFEDNTIALEQHLQNRGLNQVILLITGKHCGHTIELGDITQVVRKNSVKGLWYFLKAKYVFFTHPCFVRHFPDNVVSVNVWHGMPIKRIGRMLDKHQEIQASYTLATSPLWKDIVHQSLPPKKEILITGLPRNDHLFTPRDEVFSKLRIENSQRLIAWLPTYRKSVRGEIRRDGNDYENIFEMPDIEPVLLNSVLRANHASLWIKPHPMASGLSAREWSHIRIVEDHSLREDDLSLYQLLGASDLLITDISSVLIDFLLIDKPVIHAFPDIEEYKNSRGFSVDPIEDYFAGEVVSNQEELIAALEVELRAEDPHAKKRRALRDLSHTHQDNKATERLLEAVGLKASC